jgi:uncharacterized membrane protein (UPF0182 family)
MTTRRWLMVSAIALAVLLFLGRIAADLYTSYAWYDALGAASIWRARVGTIAMVRFASWIVASMFALGHLFTVRQSVVSLVVQRQIGGIEFPETIHGRMLTWSVVALSLVIGGLVAIAQTDWTTAFLAANGGAFGELEPNIGADLGFFVFWLPFEVQLWTWTIFVVLITTAVVITLYVVTAGIRVESGRLRFSTHARRHLTVMAGILTLMLAWHFRLEMYERLLAGTGPGGAFTFLDHRVAVPGTLILSLATLGAALVIMIAGVSNHRLAIVAIASVLLLWLVARQFAPNIVDRFTRTADPAARERAYLATQAGYSRRAFGIDAIRQGDSAVMFRSADSAIASTAVWDNHTIRLAIDPTASLDDTTGWVAWRPSQRGPVAEVVRRTLDPNDADRDTWTVTTVDGAAVDPTGDYLVVADPLAGVGPGGERSIRAPLMYPGASTYDIISDSTHRVVGVATASRLSRLAHAWSLQSPQFVAGRLPSPRPTLVQVRDVRERVDRLAPFFVQGQSVTPLIVGDTVYWSVNLYAASNWYPLSVPVTVGANEWRYFQHAAVAVVDGFSGDVLIVPDDQLDPLARVWVSRFQSLFTTPAALPPGLRAMLPPAVDQLRAQAMIFGRFGSTSIPASLEHPVPEPEADSAATVGYPVALTRDRRAVMTMMPLLDTAEHVRAVLYAVGGSQIRTVWQGVSSDSRWSGMLDKLRSLDSASGRRAPPARHVSPRSLVANSRLVVVEPVFTTPPDGSPVFSHIALMTGDSVRRAVPARRDPMASGGDVRGQVQAIYAAMRAALLRNDWVAFGRSMDALGRVAGAPAVIRK